jgi:hypothetical protein
VGPIPRQVGNGWVLDAVFADGKAQAIKGFRTEAEASEWPGSAGHVMWLRDNRVGPRVRAALAAFGYLEALAFILACVASVLADQARPAWSSVRRAVASRVPERAHESWRAAKLMAWAFWRRAAHRRRLIAMAILLAVVVIAVNRGSAERPDGSGAIARPEVGAGTPPPQSPPIEPAGVSDPIALLLGRLAAAAAEPPVSQPEPAVSRLARPDENEGEIGAPPPRHDLRAPNSPAIVGVWVPEPGSCSSRNPREGILPAVISTHGARAGDTSCVFKSQKQTERDWRMRASCSNPRETWTANVRLTVTGNRLIWASNRGIQTYTRCRSDV